VKEIIEKKKKMEEMKRLWSVNVFCTYASECFVVNERKKNGKTICVWDDLND
jgi:hypothetical protein